MLKIAVIANSYQEGIGFVNYKFIDKVKEMNKVNGTFTLHNGDVLYLCYNEEGREKYASMIYDAFIVTPMYQSLLDLIIHRQQR